MPTKSDTVPAHFIGILISVIFYAIGSGLIEVLVSPIVEACPFENKDGMMSLLHSFYCWGAVGVILGLAVGIMWPGTISISSQKCPKGGTAMFAFLALAGDLGATVSPAMVGSLSELAGGNLKIGLLIATIFPIMLIAGLLALNKVVNKKSS